MKTTAILSFRDEKKSRYKEPTVISDKSAHRSQSINFAAKKPIKVFEQEHLHTEEDQAAKDFNTFTTSGNALVEGKLSHSIEDPSMERVLQILLKDKQL
mmetsp:Transcript_18688/g.28619  ORF Transcript_18688/g.28619 Transcript_18688/m.28619 type:complete len:99 (+) Transcript_18688:745-1041(+)